MYAQLNSNILQNKKTRRLMNALGLNPRETLGILASLWVHALVCAEDGVLSGYTTEDIADAIFWPHDDGQRIVQALVNAGFLELYGDAVNGDYTIASWEEHTGKSLSMRFRIREQNRERQARNRAKRKTKKQNDNDYPEHLANGHPNPKE